jgi:GMP synthase-like glutamine amidotransferase
MMPSLMSRAYILQQVAHEGPGRIIPVFRDFGIPTEVRHLYRGDEVPTDLDAIRVLVVLGGPMNVSDVGGSEYPFLAPQVELLTRLIEHDRAVLGICLGAQLLAHAGGAKVYPNTKPGATPDDPPIPVPELGRGGVSFPFPGGTEPMVMGMIDGTPMFHWHFQTFDLPRLPAPANPAPPPAPRPPTGNSLLSSTRACKNQAYRFKTRLFGFQYHFELTPEGIDAILAHSKDVAAQAPGGEAQIREDTRKYYSRYERHGNKLLDNFVQFLKAY